MRASPGPRLSNMHRQAFGWQPLGTTYAGSIRTGSRSIALSSTLAISSGVIASLGPLSSYYGSAGSSCPFKSRNCSLSAGRAFLWINSFSRCEETRRRLWGATRWSSPSSPWSYSCITISSPLSWPRSYTLICCKNWETLRDLRPQPCVSWSSSESPHCFPSTCWSHWSL